jgi:hemoglobin/transferrin/lactoferrin receptor protein
MPLIAVSARASRVFTTVLHAICCVLAVAAPAHAQSSSPVPARLAGAASDRAEQAAGATGSAGAEQPKKEEAPEPLFFDVTVSAASRVDEESRKTPQAVSVATRDAIERRQARTPNQMLREEPGVWSVQVSAQGSPIIRGLIGNRVLYMWDGIRLNNGALFSGPNGFFNQFPIGAVERMEVVRGPGAVQYGSDAIGGVINIVQRAVDVFSSAPQAGGDFTARYGSVDGEKTEYGNLWLSTNRISLSGGVTGQDIGDFTAPGGLEQRNTGLKTVGGYGRLALRVGQADQLKVAWIHDRRFDVETYTQSKLNASGVPRIFGPFEARGIGRVDYVMPRPQGPIKETRLYGYHQYYDSARDNTVETASLFNRTRTDTRQRVTGAGGQAMSTIGSHRLVYGLDFRAEDLLAARTLHATAKASGLVTTTIPNGNVPPGSYQVFDAFALFQTELTSRLSWSAGSRFETSKLHSEPRPQDALTPFTVDDLRLDKRWSSVTWSTGAVYALAGGWSLAGNVATGFRAPTFSDTLNTGVPVFASGVASVPSPAIDPERSLTFEAGPRFASATLNLSLTAYSTQLTDLLNSTAAGTIDIPGVGIVNALKNANIASAHVRGLEAAVAYRLRRSLTVRANATVTRGQNTFTDKPLRFIPPANGMVSATYDHQSGRWWIEGSTVFADRLRRHAPEDELDAGFSTDPGFGSPSATNPPLPGFVIPGFTVANLRAGATVWRDQQGGRRRLEITVDVNNLFDRRYREAYSQQQLYAPARGAVIGATVRF